MDTNEITRPAGLDQAPDVGPATPTPATDAKEEAVGQAIEPALEPALEPIRRASGRTSGRARWAVALAIVALVAAVSIVGVGVAAFGGASSALAPWAPATTTAYAELRTDLPGDQQAAVGSLLARFPGFDDQASLDMKVDTAIGDLVARVSGSTVDYGRDLKPWLGGEIALAVGSIDTLAPSSNGGVTGGWGLLLATTKDPAVAQAFLTARFGTPTRTETIGSATVQDVAVPGLTDRSIAWAVVGTTVLVGDRAAVESGIDAHATGGLGAVAAFRQAYAYVPAEHVATAWADLPTLESAALEARTALAPDASPLPSAATTRIPPPWAVAYVRAAASGLTVDVVVPRPTDIPVDTPHVSTVAERLPGDTIAAIEVRDVGARAQRVLDAVAKTPGLTDQLGPAAPIVDGALGSFVDWAGDGAVVLTRSGGTPSGGIVVTATEPDVAATRVAAIRALLAFADGPNGRPVLTEEPYGDGKIVTVDFGDVRDAVTKAITDGIAGGTPAMPATDLAMIREMLPASASVAYTVQRGVFVLGTDAAFVKDVVDTTPADSLATSADYGALVALVGPSNDGQAFVDASAAVDLARSADPSISTALGGDVSSFVDRIQSLGAAWTVADDVIRLRLALAVRAR